EAVGGVEGGEARAGGRRIALGPRRALRRARRPSADAVSRALAHATGLAPARRRGPRGRGGGRGGLRVGGGLQSGVQETGWPGARPLRSWQRLAPLPVGARRSRARGLRKSRTDPARLGNQASTN